MRRSGADAGKEPPPRPQHPCPIPGWTRQTGEYGEESTDVIRRYIECGELRLTRRRRT
jgi:hypothetical protein